MLLFVWTVNATSSFSCSCCYECSYYSAATLVGGPNERSSAIIRRIVHICPSCYAMGTCTVMR